MNAASTVLLASLLLFCLFSANLSWAGQVVTEKTKLWAKEAIQKEKAMEYEPSSNTLALLYFNNKTGRSELDVLQKGLTIVLMTDLSKVEEIQLVERVKVQALLEELEYGKTGIVDAETMPEVGQLLGAVHLVGGHILMEDIDRFQFEADLLKVPTETIFGNAKTYGKLIDEFFLMEKELLFQIIRALKIELAKDEQLELKKHLTTSLKALLYFVEGVEHSDRGDYMKARQSYANALKEDPNLALADRGIKEIDSIPASAHSHEAYSRSSHSQKTKRFGRGCRGRRNSILRGLR